MQFGMCWVMGVQLFVLVFEVLCFVIVEVEFQGFIGYWIFIWFEGCVIVEFDVGWEVFQFFFGEVVLCFFI